MSYKYSKRTECPYCRQNGGKLKKITDVTLCVSSNNTQRIQESHILIGHIICDYVEKNLTSKKS